MLYIEVMGFRLCGASLALLTFSMIGCGDDPVEKACIDRRTTALNPNQVAFNETSLRWSCADTPAIEGVERGQEYCEYFALLALPNESVPRVLGRLDRIPRNSGDDDDLCNLPDPEFRTTNPSVELSNDQILALEQSPSGTVGQCIFSSWNEDIFQSVPGCAANDPRECPTILGLELSAQLFKMKFTVNSAEAAQLLLEDCYAAGLALADEPSAPALCPSDPPTESITPDENRSDSFDRGCHLNAEINGTIDRKSDAILCATAMRLGECGCDSLSPDESIGTLLSPFSKRGFPLGTWAAPDQLPPGCGYLPVGDGSQTLVACDISAADVLESANDVKQFCRDRYAPNVVVYAPIPSQNLSCDPASSNSGFRNSCSSTPWVLNDSR